jgi:hypothetical protein
MPLVAFLDVITFFGLASFFAWLTYAPLQRDVLDDFKQDEEHYVKARKNFYRINDHFLISLLFYSAAVISEYVLHGGFQGNVFYASAPLRFFVGVCFLAGLVTLSLPVWYMRSIGTGHVDLVTIRIHSFSYTLAVLGFASIDLVINSSSFTEIVLSLLTRGLFWPPAALSSSMMPVTLFGAWLMLKYFKRSIGQVMGVALLAIAFVAGIVTLLFPPR